MLRTASIGDAEVSPWVKSDQFAVSGQCPLSTESTGLLQRRPARQARSRQVVPLGRVQTLLSMCAPNISTVVGKRIRMRVLLIEDDSATAQSIELMLKSESFNVYSTDLGEEGIDLGKIYDYDIILLDLNLPDMSGFEVLRKLRISRVKTPILILSGLAGIEDKIKGLGFGADDYMTKPFHKEELVARIHAIVRRSRGHAQSVINTDDLCVNLDSKMVQINGSRVHVTGKEYQMLELLAMRKGTTLTKEMFLSHLYGGLDEPEVKIIDVFICKLRKKLANASGGKDYIETVWGRGYVMREPSENSARVSA
jgi:two-component system, cell cycle response regulator CtrA